MITMETQTESVEIILSSSEFFSEAEKETLFKIDNIKEKLHAAIVEREEILEAMFIAKLSRNHVVMIGPPGTGKSYLIESFCQGFKQYKSFNWQVTKFTTPEELFGPYSLSELKAGNYKRITKGKLPDADIAYIDEVFNANSSILNALNGLMNERIFEGNSVELDNIYGATNFIPEEKVLVAFFDRFLFRFIVDDIHESRNFEKMMIAADFEITLNEQISKTEIQNLQKKVRSVSIKGILPKIIKLRELLKIEQIEPSSRRFKWALYALQAKALLDGRKAVSEDDLFLLKHILWSDKKEISIVESVIMKAINPVAAQIKEKYDQALSIEKSLKLLDPDNSSDDLNTIREGLVKLKSIIEDIKEIQTNNVLMPRVNEIAEKLANKVSEIRSEIFDKKLGMLLQ